MEDSTHKAQPTLLGIPFELREKILEHLVDGSGPPVKASHTTSMKDIKHGVDKQTRNLLLTCSQLHENVEAILIRKRTYEFDFVNDTRRFLETYEHLGSIRNIQFGINLCNMTAADLESVCSMLQPHLTKVEKLVLVDPMFNFLQPTAHFEHAKYRKYIPEPNQVFTFTSKFVTIRDLFSNPKESRIFVQHHGVEANNRMVSADTLILISEDVSFTCKYKRDGIYFLCWESFKVQPYTTMPKVCRHELAADGSYIFPEEIRWAGGDDTKSRRYC